VRSLFPDANPTPLRTVRAVFDAIAHGKVAAGSSRSRTPWPAPSTRRTTSSLGRHPHRGRDRDRGGPCAGRASRHDPPGGQAGVVAPAGARAVRRVSGRARRPAPARLRTAGAAKRIVEEEREGERRSRRSAPRSSTAGRPGTQDPDQPGRTRRGSPRSRRTRSRSASPTRRRSSSSREQPGALFHCLGPFAQRELNLVKLESRPVGHTPGDTGSSWTWRPQRTIRVREALEEVQGSAMVQVLGLVRALARERSLDAQREGSCLPSLRSAATVVARDEGRVRSSRRGCPRPRIQVPLDRYGRARPQVRGCPRKSARACFGPALLRVSAAKAMQSNWRSRCSSLFS